MDFLSTFAREFAARVCRPGATLFVNPRGQNGYCWGAQPLYADALSSEISEVTDAAIWVTLQRLDQSDGMTLLRRLAVSSPVRFQFRPNYDMLPPNELLGEIYYLTKRFRTSRPEARLLVIPGKEVRMNLTNRPSFDDALSSRLTPFRHAPASLSGCPVCGASSANLQAAYPGTEGCLRCRAIFVART
jgi:hypothetical protein